MVKTKHRNQVKGYHHRILRNHLSVGRYLHYYADTYSHKMRQFEDNYITDKIRAIEKCHY